MFIVEAFQPRRLLTPLQAIQEREGKRGGEERGREEKGREERGGGRGGGRVGVLDLNGHFACCLKLEDGSFFVLNTTDGSYVRSEIVAMADVVLHSR